MRGEIPSFFMINITILIRHHNRKTLERTIDSALSQNVEKTIIVIDDGSVKKLSKKYQSKVTYIYNKVNQGELKVSQEALALVKTKYFIFLDDDDCFANPFILRKLLNSIGDADMVYGDCVLMRDGEIVGKWSYNQMIPSNYRQEVINRNGSGMIPFYKALVRTSFIRKHKLNIELPIVGDTLISVRMIEKGAVLRYIPYDVTLLEIGSGISSSPQRQEAINNLLEILKKGN